MSQKSGTAKLSSERVVRDVRRATRKQYSAEEKIRIVLDGLRGEHSIAELCRREGIAEQHDRGWGRRGMRYPASEKLEIIWLLEQSYLPVCRTLEKLGVPRPTFYR